MKDPTRMLRYQAGELSYPIASLQRYRPLVGVGVARQFDLQPYRVTQPGGRTGFTLESTSTVDVYVNGTLVAKAEIVVIQDKFGIRLTDIISPAERMRRLSRQ
jgi:outer membrane usher protein FimD/PapC